MTESDFLAAFNQPWHIARDVSEPFSLSKRPAAVLICLNPHKNASGTELNVIFTKRATHLKHHAGQVSFPGGKAEDEDESLIHTAYRETHEEIGICPSNLELIGTLPPFRTISGFAVTPVVAKHRQGVCIQNDLTIDKNEVSAAFQVPLAYLMDKQNYFVHEVSRDSATHPVYFIPYQRNMIWGATAGMLAHLRDHILCHS